MDFIHLTIICVTLQTLKSTVPSDKVRIRRLLHICYATNFQRRVETKEWSTEWGQKEDMQIPVIMKEGEMAIIINAITKIY